MVAGNGPTVTAPSASSGSLSCAAAAATAENSRLGLKMALSVVEVARSSSARSTLAMWASAKKPGSCRVRYSGHLQVNSTGATKASLGVLGMMPGKMRRSHSTGRGMLVGLSCLSTMSVSCRVGQRTQQPAAVGSSGQQMQHQVISADSKQQNSDDGSHSELRQVAAQHVCVNSQQECVCRTFLQSLLSTVLLLAAVIGKHSRGTFDQLILALMFCFEYCLHTPRLCRLGSLSLLVA